MGFCIFDHFISFEKHTIISWHLIIKKIIVLIKSVWKFPFMV